MSEQAVFRKCLPGRWTLAVLAACLLRAAPLGFASNSESHVSAIDGPRLDAPSYRRCKWQPRQEHCYWVKTGTKVLPPR